MPQKLLIGNILRISNILSFIINFEQINQFQSIIAMMFSMSGQKILFNSLILFCGWINMLYISVKFSII